MKNDILGRFKRAVGGVVESKFEFVIVTIASLLAGEAIPFLIYIVIRLL